MRLFGKFKRESYANYVCEYCGRDIKVGQPYFLLKYNHKGIRTVKVHERCGNIMETLEDYMDFDTGTVGAVFRETCKNFCKVYVCPKCDKWQNGKCIESRSYCLNKIDKTLEGKSYVKVGDKWRIVDKVEPVAKVSIDDGDDDTSWMDRFKVEREIDKYERIKKD